MLELLPEVIKPQSLFDTGGAISGVTPLTKMGRLSALLVHNNGAAETHLIFDKDAQGLRVVQGSIQAKLPLICQRCLKTVDYPVDINLSLALVLSEAQSDRLPDSYEPLLYDQNKLFLTALVEDELLLALPLVAMHAEGECSSRTEINVGFEPELEPGTEKPHPFAVLAQIKGKSDST